MYRAGLTNFAGIIGGAKILKNIKYHTSTSVHEHINETMMPL
jgi:hypothetical protein